MVYIKPEEQKKAIGVTVNNLTVLEIYPKNRALCRCACGVVRVFRKSHVLTSVIKSCGCKKAALCAAVHITHGASNKSPEYAAWKGMHGRCYNKHNRVYYNYGGRGIRVCSRWSGKSGFVDFLADMGNRPSMKHSIDRFPDQNGDYSPSNCRWATSQQQNRNRRNNRLLSVAEKTQTLAEWADESGIDRRVISDRIRRGWDAERAVTVPVGSK